MTRHRQEICVAIVNFCVKSGDKEANLKKIEDFTAEAAKMGANLILFPEMCLTGYDYYTDDTIKRKHKYELAETVPGPAINRISEMAKEHNIYVVIGLPEKVVSQDEQMYNSAAVVGPEGLVGVYRKIHPYDKENTWCLKGDQPLLFDTEWGPIGVGICYDTYHFPELMRYYAWKGCRLYLNLTAVIRETVIKDALQEGYLTYLKSGVLMNHIFIASSNLVGQDRTSYFGGGSVVLGPQVINQDVIAYSYCYGGDINCDDEKIFTVSIDLNRARRSIFENNTYTNQPDFRPEIYLKLYK